ncbi:hypothetical protein C5167_035272 [Papaver somniferum]|uniref:R13L1/DRL21-like LRR repeat region domain-containing protein n=1 Tax=Papaver somniferum TaxID=3469 RepID=A0A4Y7KH90_PAPSO|nr:hypothetical protein C5167_035272 [Papaver somniferum]
MKELKYHNHLKGDLAIKGLGRLNSEEEAAEAELHKKYQLNALRLSFKPSGATLASLSSGRQVRQQKPETLVVERLMESLLEVLKPHPNLKKLTIYQNMGFRYPGWMGSTEALTNLRYLGLHNCSNCTELPSLGLLPSLEVDTFTPFPKLTVLEITDMSSLEVVDLGEIVEGKGESRELQHLNIYANLDDSIKLIPEYVQNLTKLQHLMIYSYGKEQEVGDWSILSYIPSVTLNGKKIRSINQNSQ